MNIIRRMIYKVLQAKAKGTCGRTLETGVDKGASEQPSRFNLRGIKMEVTSFNGRNMFVFRKKGASGKRHVIFLHGGGYVCQSSRMHWSFVADFVRKSGLVLYYPDYPLAPEHHSGAALEFVYDYYCHHLKTCNPDSVIVMGDSAGAGLSLSLLMKIRNEEIKMPEKGILISPFLDSELSDNRQREIDPQDPILTVDGLKACGKAYAGSLGLEDWRVNPIKGDLSGLCPLSIYTSDLDILHIDALRLKENLEEMKQSYTFYFEEGMPHDWVLFPGLPEARKARALIVGECV